MEDRARMRYRSLRVDYYAALGVPPTASTEEIERAYRALARKVHPDRNGQDAAAAEARMKQLNQIRETLTDPLLRSAYDDRLRADRGDGSPGAPRPAPTPPPQSPEPPSENRWQRPGARPGPHPHVVGFLHTEATQARRPPAPRILEPAPMILLMAALAAGVALLWPRPEQPLPAIAPPPRPPVRPKSPQVTVVRGDQTALRRAVRKTAKVVPLGATFDEVIAKFGPPDRFERGPNGGDLVLVYGQVRVELRDGRVSGGSP
jgi:hypothetical protein